MNDGGRLGPHRDRILDLLVSSDLLVAVHDRDDVLRYANAAYRTLFGARVGEAIAWPEMMARNERNGIGVQAQTDDYAKWLIAVQARRGKVPFRAFELDMKGGRWLWLTEIIDDAGWMLSIGADVTAIQHGSSGRTARRDVGVALRVARTDDLTGALNRRGIISALEDVAERMPAQQRRYSLALLDLDHFKQVNDAYGHEVGDTVLVRFVDHVQSCMRRSDFFGRYGGEEFLLVLPDADAQAACTLVARIRESIPAIDVPGVEVPLQLSFSAGVREVRTPQLTRDLLKWVDDALYRAKDAGRAVTVVATS